MRNRSVGKRRAVAMVLATMGWFSVGNNLGAVSFHCDSATCAVADGKTATVLYSYDTAPTLQEITVRDISVAPPYDYPPYFFTTSGQTVPTTPTHSYTITVYALITGNWYSDICPPVNCGGPAVPLSISGNVRAAENPAIALDNIWVELRDSRGKVLSTYKTTAGSPIYNFGNLLNGTYSVDVVVDRNEFASPVQSLVILNGASAARDFSIQGYPVPIKVTDNTNGTLAVITTAAWSGATPPPDLNWTAPVTQNLYAGIVDASGVVVLKVPGNFPYSLTCWRPTGPGIHITYSQTAPLAITGPAGNVMPKDALGAFACP